ncbi:M48 family metallopeptidase [Oceanicola sp. S124]|uniref:M48 family metallopeptidase n=1 Tax=Oceanicola sp. S124 TaxID=1042378 RepID=UPI0002557EAF|nr:SprT family zinc-dependent metalloprotease [Oceanicola sp. S124]
MGQHHLPGNPPIPLILRRSAQAKRISLRVSSLDGRVTLTLPRRVPEREALAFAAEKEDWLRHHLARQGAAEAVGPGTLLPVEGFPRQVVAGTRRGVRLLPDRIEVAGTAPGPRLAAWLRELARDRLSAACDRHSAALGLPYARITLRDTRSRWGSCTQDGALMFSWRLIMAAPEVLDYVAAHEVAHLAEMNHSPDFWNVVTQLYGDYAPARAWLRREGNALHRYRFDP